MRIGILTFHRALNYGAFLQAYALRRTILEMGHQAEVVDYWSDGHAATYALFPPLRWWKIRPLWMNVKSLAYSCLALFPAWKRKRKMRSLCCRYLNLPTEPIYRKPGELGTLQYDCLCYGSDQIWWKSVIPGYEGFDEVYWGEAVPQGVRKVAYAPSMGVISLTDHDRERVRKLLLNCDALAVRETAVRDAWAPVATKKTEVVLDPVFLIPASEWGRLCRPVCNQRYVLCYNLLHSPEAAEQARLLCEVSGCALKEITGQIELFRPGAMQTLDAIEFISWIKGAEFVVTTSFHGAAFSILFHKDFYTLGLGNKGGRIASLLEQLGLEDRLLESPVGTRLAPIDYAEVEKVLDGLVKDSRGYLERILGKGDGR